MRRLRLIVLTLLALWGTVLGVGLVAHLIIDTCSASSAQATVLGIGVASLALPFSVWRRQRGPVASGLSLLVGTGVTFFCTFLGLYPSETVFVFHPAIDTQTPPAFSRSAFLRIAPGMNETHSQGEHALSGPLTSTARGGAGQTISRLRTRWSVAGSHAGPRQHRVKERARGSKGRG